jgi:PAS domain S-box-containing protein
MIGGHSEQSLDAGSVQNELLLVALSACRAGLFYSTITSGKENIADLEQSHDPSRTWSLNIGALFGLPESPQDSSALVPYILESDQHILSDCIVEAMTERRPESVCEFRIHRADNGELRWLMARISIGLDKQGEMRYFTSVVIDVTEQKQAQESLERVRENVETAQKLLITALSSAKICVFR